MDIYVARQPIFNRDRQVVAYELLFRSGLQNTFGQNDPSTASIRMLDTTMLGFGLESLLGNRLGYFNASRKMLLDKFWSLLPPKQTVVELLETVEPDDEVVAACAAVKEAGYQLALDDFVFSPEYEALVKFADCIKIDFLATTGAERAELAQRYRARGIKMLAEKVETYEDFNEGLAAGYELFQGYFFCKPEMVATKDVSAHKGNLARLIAEVNRPELDFDALEQLIKQEVALSVKLLRFLRSAGLGWRHEVETLGQALRVLGEQGTRKWASLVALTMIGEDKPMELVTTSLIRAQFCEEVGNRVSGMGRPAELFLVGLLSTLEAMLDQPLPELLGRMALSDNVNAALLGEKNSLGDTLAMVKAYDRGDWDRVDHFAARTGLSIDALPKAYHRSVQWVGEIFQGG